MENKILIVFLEKKRDFIDTLLVKRNINFNKIL